MLHELIQADSSTAGETETERPHWDVAYFDPTSGQGGVIRVHVGIPLQDIQEGVAAVLDVSLEDLIANFSLAARHSMMDIVLTSGKHLPEGEKYRLPKLLSDIIQT